jgi:hypothetical protein
MEEQQQQQQQDFVAGVVFVVGCEFEEETDEDDEDEEDEEEADDGGDGTPDGVYEEIVQALQAILYRRRSTRA